MENTKYSVLKQYWGYDSFRQPQEEIMDTILSGQSLMALLPTGAGKSLCFQLPALLMDGACLVVTPLIALMQDQVAGLKEKGIKAQAIYSGMTYREIQIAMDQVRYGEAKLLYVSPERLQSRLFNEMLASCQISFLAIDEAHCISQWGHDFRPAYLSIPEVMETTGQVPVAAFTATATPEVAADIRKQLKIDNARQFSTSFFRENLSFSCFLEEQPEKKLESVVRSVPGSMIVYVSTRKDTKIYSDWLVRRNVSAAPYHAGMSLPLRKKVQEGWLKNQIRVVVATNAFGMGIDKPDVRAVVHLHLPSDPESYVQESGRAGRDKKKSYAVMILSEEQLKKDREYIVQRYPDIQKVKQVYFSLANFFKIALGSGGNESYNFDISKFVKAFDQDPLTVYYSLQWLQHIGLLEMNESFYRPSKIMFLVKGEELYQFQVAHPRLDPLIKVLLRMCGGNVFSSFSVIKEKEIGHHMGEGEKMVRTMLEKLEELGVIEYLPMATDPEITFLTPRQSAGEINLQKKDYEQLKKTKSTKLLDVLSYIRLNHLCRAYFLASSFGDQKYFECGICDHCLERKNKSYSQEEVNETLLEYFKTHQHSNLSEVQKAFRSLGTDKVIQSVRHLVDHDIISLEEEEIKWSGV